MTKKFENTHSEITNYFFITNLLYESYA